MAQRAGVMRRMVPVALVISIFIAGAAIGRLVVVPWLQKAAAPAGVASLGPRGAQMPYAECLAEALGRRMDPIEARHSCTTIAGNL
jgi:hypothetical protein